MKNGNATLDDLKSLAEQAVALHQQGNLAEAEKLYLHILQQDAGLFGPRFYLGIMRLQQNRAPEAVDLLAQALKIMPQDINAKMNYGMALRAAGRSAEAVESFDTVLAAQPNMIEALYNRGVAQADIGQYEKAVDSYDRALVIDSRYIPALVNRGAALTALARFDDAVSAYDRVLVLQPANVLAMNARGLALRAKGRFAEALADFDRAVAASPIYSEAAYNRAVALLDLERTEEALAGFESVLAARPEDAELFNNRGVALWNLKRPAEALASFDRAVTIEPDFGAAWGNRGLALQDLARLDEALASFDRVLALMPKNAVALNSRGTVLRALKRYDEAVESYSRAIAVRPDYAEALNNRAYTLWGDQQDYARAMADMERALALDPGHAYAEGEILHMKMYGADWSDFAARKAAIEAGVRAGKKVVRPFIFQAVADKPADLQACSRIWARDMYPQIASAPHDPAARKGRKKIRVGYVSGEFRQQATAILMAGLYEAHDKAKFEIVALDNGRDDGSEMRKRLEKSFDKLIPISALSDEEAAAKIRAEEIDILVNLNGYFGQPRMGVFARRPAPVQVNYLGFPATLGTPYLDYILADTVVIPAGEEQFYDEKVVRLPGCYQVNDNKGRPIARPPTRAQAGLPEDAIVFCNFNNSYKLTPDVFASWMRILKQVPGSVLWLLEGTAPLAENLAREAKNHGVDPARILFAPDRDPDLHLARLTLADLFLDSLPYNAHTTASDALWAGVPLLTRRGTTFPGRVAASLLLAANLPELVTETAEEYEALAVKLATDGKTLKGLRARLKDNRDSCALFDTDRFRRNVEAAYDRMWQRWLSGKPPEGFALEKDA